MPGASIDPVSELRSAVTVSLNNMYDSFNARMSTMEKTIEILEETNAALVAGFAEQTVMIEAILGSLSLETAEEQEAFSKAVSEGRAAMFKIMQEQADVMAETNPGAAAAMERVVEEKRAAPTSE